MKRLGQRAGRSALFSLVIAAFWLAGCASAPAGPQYAAMVIDARDGKVLHSQNADTRLHPASLTKMMTLYVTFQAVERGEISLDTKVRISRNATLEPPSKIYLKEGQRIALRYLIRAAAIKSANDAATALAEAVGGTEARFIDRMNATAKALGMSKTTFRNAHGLTATGHLSTARDMTTLGRHLFYDYPDYYHLFSRRTAQVGSATVANTNRRLLDAYPGADGIKTGYTNAAGSNLVASAERGGERIIATVFGGSSSAARNKRVAELLDLGFRKAPSRVAVVKPRKPGYVAPVSPLLVSKSALPRHRPASIIALAVARQMQVAALDQPVDPAQGETVEVAAADLPDAITDAQTGPDRDGTDRDGRDVVVADTDLIPLAETEENAPGDAELADIDLAAADPDTALPEPAPEIVSMRQGVEQMLEEIANASAQSREDRAQKVAAAIAPPPAAIARPDPRPARVTYSTAALKRDSATNDMPLITVSTANGPANWGVRVGRYTSRGQAERMLLRTALQQVDLLRGAKRQVVSGRSGFAVEFVGLSEQAAALTCQRLAARDEPCAPFGS